MILLDELKSKKTPIIAAPLAGYMDPPWASILAELSVRHMIYPFVSSEGITRRVKYLKEISLKLDLWRKNVPRGGFYVQIFGSDPNTMAETAKFLEKEIKVDAIDLNMGCSVKKIWKAKSGSFLLKDPKNAIEITKNVVHAVNIPVTLKTRTGWNHSDENGLTIIREAVKVGVKAVTLHPRRGADQFRGKANWNEITQIVQEVEIPVIGNGDINSAKNAQRMLEQTNCAGVMIGRASIGNPWIFRQCEELLNNNIELPAPSAFELIDACLMHIKKQVEFRGGNLGVRESRKHIGRYLKGLPRASEIRSKLVQLENFEDIHQTLQQYKADLNLTLVEE